MVVQDGEGKSDVKTESSPSRSTEGTRFIQHDSPQWKSFSALLSKLIIRGEGGIVGRSFLDHLELHDSDLSGSKLTTRLHPHNLRIMFLSLSPIAIELLIPFIISLVDASYPLPPRSPLVKVKREALIVSLVRVIIPAPEASSDSPWGEKNPYSTIDLPTFLYMYLNKMLLMRGWGDGKVDVALQILSKSDIRYKVSYAMLV